MDRMKIVQGCKAQLTVYIILGLVLVILVTSLVYVGQLSNRVPSKSVPSIVVDAPAELQSLFAFVTACVEQVGEEGLRLIGSQGGYVAPRFPMLQNSPTESEMVALSPNSGVKVPYWSFMQSKNDCSSCGFSSHKPLLRGSSVVSSSGQSIQQELESYVDENLAGCINGFNDFSQLNASASGVPKTKATITPDNVVLEVNYPISASSAGKVLRLDSFVGELDVRLQELYEIASSLAQLEVEHRFLERATKNLITGFSRVNSNALPPFSATELGMDSGVFWVKSDVQKKLSQVLSAYIPMLQVWGTDSFAWRSASANVRDKGLFELFYNRDMLVPLAKRHKGISAKFSYLDWWPVFFDLNCRGQLCGPETFQNTFGFVFGMQKYAFAYDVSAPVFVELSESSAFGGRNGGFSFNFMLELNLRNNNPVTLNSDLSSFALPVQGSLLCDQRSSALVTVEIINRATAKPQPASLSFSCGSEACAIGAALNGSLTARMPVCFGGSLSAVQDNFVSASVPLSTSISDSKQVLILLEPVRELNLDVKRLLLKKQNNGSLVLDATPLAHGKNDQTVVRFTPVNNAGKNTGESVVVEVLGDMSSSKPSVHLAPGEYAVSILTISSDDIIIPVQERCEGVVDKECVNVPSEPAVFGSSKPLPVGGAQFVWRVLPEQLDSAKSLTLFTLYSGISLISESERVIEDVQLGISVADFSSQYQSVLRPVFS
ncbi:MAG: hypothetical protein Q7K43_01625 [Candidatus Woesearchaeota archaeon]|nr:hypothetical protein [Candidatus Woesearchaeota archaeon]